MVPSERPQESVKHHLMSTVPSRDRPRRVDADGVGPEGRRGTRGIERREGAVGSAQEAVTHEACVEVISRDRPRWVVAAGVCAVDGTRGIERGEGAVGSPQESVEHALVQKSPMIAPAGLMRKERLMWSPGDRTS